MSLMPYIFNDHWDPLKSSNRFLDRYFRPEIDEVITPLNEWFRSPWDRIPPWRSAVRNIDPEATITSDRDKFQVNLDVQNFKPHEITVNVSGGNTITVEGKHEEKPNDHGYVSRQFLRRYVLPDGHDVESIVSNLSSDGVLTVTAPRYGHRIALGQRTIPIQRSGILKSIGDRKYRSTN